MGYHRQKQVANEVEATNFPTCHLALLNCQHAAFLISGHSYYCAVKKLGIPVSLWQYQQKKEHTQAFLFRHHQRGGAQKDPYYAQMDEQESYFFSKLLLHKRRQRRKLKSLFVRITHIQMVGLCFSSRQNHLFLFHFAQFLL